MSIQFDMRLLYPTNPLKPREADESYFDEYSAAVSRNINVSLFSYEEFLSGTFRVRPLINTHEIVLYRGWMFKPTQYCQLCDNIAGLGGTMFTAPEKYVLCHQLPSWYPFLAEFTPETLFFQESDDIASKLKKLSWTCCFLKDYVKSLSIKDGSMVSDLSKIPDVISRMKIYRGEIEGGICARRIEDFDQSTEDRYFVFHGKIYSREAIVPEVVKIAAQRIDSPFFSVDTIRRRDGVTRIVELGDGQVSDRKKWRVEQFLEILIR